MKQQALAIWEKVKATWAAWSKARKLTVAIVAACVIAASVTIWAVSSQQSYDYLFTDLSTEDAAAIVGKLGELKIPYKVEASGSAILVPAERVHEIRLQIAGAGLPRGGGVGFELFDKTRFGTTEFEQQVNLRRALEGELSRTISTISSVKSARVHLVLPERSVFLHDKEAGSASVVLQLFPERVFGKRETQAIVHLVSSAVPGLSPDHVSVVTTDGTTLHQPAEGQAGSAGGDTLADQEVEIAKVMESRVRALLERAVGAGHVDVRVGVELDSSTSEHMEERYGKGSLRSDQLIKEGGGAAESSAEGIPGARSNLPEAEAAPSGSASPDDAPAAPPEPDTGDGTSTAYRVSRTRNWEVDRVTEKRTTPAGNIKRMTVAVMVDGIHKSTAEGAQEYADRSPEELKQLSSMVKGAVGFNEGRGDTVEVASMRFFAPEDLAAAAPPAPLRSKWLRWPYLAGAGGVGALALATMFWRLRRRRAAKGKELALASVHVSQLGDGSPDVALELSGASPAELPAPSALETEGVREAAVELATRDPATAAVILREWLSATVAGAPAAAAAPELPRA